MHGATPNEKRRGEHRTVSERAIPDGIACLAHHPAGWCARQAPLRNKTVKTSINNNTNDPLQVRHCELQNVRPTPAPGCWCSCSHKPRHRGICMHTNKLHTDAFPSQSRPPALREKIPGYRAGSKRFSLTATGDVLGLYHPSLSAAFRSRGHNNGIRSRKKAGSDGTLIGSQHSSRHCQPCLD